MNSYSVDYFGWLVSMQCDITADDVNTLQSEFGKECNGMCMGIKNKQLICDCEFRPAFVYVCWSALKTMCLGLYA